MKRSGIYHNELAQAVARMGHGDIILIGDVGCAWPQNGLTICIDLAVSDGIPMVKDVLAAVLQELVVEQYIVAQETLDMSPNAHELMKRTIARYGDHSRRIGQKISSHQEMKRLWLDGHQPGEQMKVFVRTGERTPYGYIMLVAGVDF